MESIQPETGDENPEVKINTHLAESEPLNKEQELALRDKLLAEIPSASSIEDLARIKQGSLELDLQTGYLQEVDKAIVARFKELLRDKVYELSR